MSKLGARIRQAVHKQYPDLQVELRSGQLWIELPTGRHQVVRIERKSDRCRMVSTVIGAARAQSLGKEKLLPNIWIRNRETSVVGFNLDKHGRLIGSVEQLMESADSEELAYYAVLLARECDLFQYVLSGQDDG